MGDGKRRLACDASRFETIPRVSPPSYAIFTPAYMGGHGNEPITMMKAPCRGMLSSLVHSLAFSSTIILAISTYDSLLISFLLWSWIEFTFNISLTLYLNYRLSNSMTLNTRVITYVTPVGYMVTVPNRDNWSPYYPTWVDMCNMLINGSGVAACSQEASYCMWLLFDKAQCSY